MSKQKNQKTGKSKIIVSDFECTECHTVFEEYITEPDTDTMQCLKCGAPAKRIISFNTHHRADPTWLESACEVLQGDGENRIESRSEFDKYLKKHGIAQRC